MLKASYLEMTEPQREFFASILPEPVRWFADWGFEQWAAILEQIEFPRRDEILTEARANRQVVDYSQLIKLCEELRGSTPRASGSSRRRPRSVHTLLLRPEPGPAWPSTSRSAGRALFELVAVDLERDERQDARVPPPGTRAAASRCWCTATSW